MTYNLYTHYQEIRLRVLYLLYSIISAAIVSYIHQVEITYIFTKSLHMTLIATEVTETFFSLFKLTFFTSLLFCLPFLMYQIWCFVRPSLYQMESVRLNKFLILFSFFFLIELWSIHCYFFPKICHYFLSYEMKNFINISPKISSYFTYTLQLYFGLLFLFQIPFLFLILFYTKTYSALSLTAKRHLFLLFFLILSALCSPPDILSQVVLTGIIYFIFEICLLIGCML